MVGFSSNKMLEGGSDTWWKKLSVSSRRSHASLKNGLKIESRKINGKAIEIIVIPCSRTVFALLILLTFNTLILEKKKKNYTHFLAYLYNKSNKKNL